MFNCSLAPAPESIVHFLRAQEKANHNGIVSTLTVSQMTINGFLTCNNNSTLVLNEPKYTHLMILSDDTKCDDDLIIRLIRDDKDIVSGIYRTKDPNDTGLAIYGDIGEPFGEYITKGLLLERKFCSSHSMLVKRVVLEKMKEAFPELTYKGPKGETIYGLWMPFVRDNTIYCDDWAFCQRAKELGFTCWVDFGVHLDHRCDIWLGI